ncbi:MAG: Dabb family protein [Bacteroidota bacterium]
MKKALILTFITLAFFNCSNQSELETLKAQLAQTQTALEAAQAQLEDTEDEDDELTHLVFFKVKPEAIDSLLAEIKKLEAIEEIEVLEVGLFEDLDDPRAFSDYNVIMETTFASEEAYQKYQQHPIHLALKKNAKSFFVGPPATYDYR